MISWIKKLFFKKEEKAQVEKTLLWGIVDGPIASKDIPDCNFPPEYVMMVLKISRGEEVFDAECWFPSLDDAYVLMKHFKSSVEPIELNEWMD